MKKLLFFIAALTATLTAAAQPNPTAYRNAEIEKSSMYLNGNDYQKDLLLFVDMLRTTHPAFTEDVSPTPIDLEKARREAYWQLKLCGSEQQFEAVLNRIVLPLRDGHTCISPSGGQSQEYFPINLIFCSDGYYVSATDVDYIELLGKEVISINGLEMDDVTDRLYANLGVENRYKVTSYINHFLPVPYILEQSGICGKERSIEVVCRNGEKAIISPKERSYIRFVTLTSQPPGLTRYSEAPFWYRIIDDLDVCYLQFNKCEDYNTMMYLIRSVSFDDETLQTNIEKLQRSGLPKFDEFLDRMFSEIEKRNIGNLVVDVRHNSGGNSTLCDQLLSHLRPSESINSFDTYLRFSVLLEESQPGTFNNLRNTLRDDLPLSYSKLYSARNDFQRKNNPYVESSVAGADNPDTKELFNGGVYFLQGPETYSSAGILLTLVRDNEIGTIVGENGIYRPSHYGDILMWQLPNTGTTGFISHKYFVRPDASKSDEESLTPDIVIYNTIGDIQSGRDPQWEWIMQDIRTKSN